MELTSLEVKLGITGVENVEGGLRRVKTAEDAAAGGAEEAAFSFGLMEIPILKVAAAAAAATVVLGGLATTLAAVSGVRIAAEFQRLEIGFKTLLGSEKAALELMADLRKMGEETPFKTEELVGFARQLVATGSTAKGVVRELKAITDAVSAAGGQTYDVGRLAEVMSKIRISPKIEMREVEEIARAGINLKAVVSAGTGQNLPTNAIAMQKLQSMKGEQAFDVIVKGLEKVYGGAAGAQANAFLGIMQNLQETVGNIMLPTGKLLLIILSPLAGVFLTLANALQVLNNQTAGVAGVLAIMVLLRAGWVYIALTLRAGYKATMDLIAALQRYAATAEAAAVATNVNTAAQARNAVAVGVGGAAATVGAASKAVGIGSLIPRLMGGGIKAVIPELGALAKGILPAAGNFMKGFGPAIILSLGAELIGNWMKGSKNKNVSGAGDYVAAAGTWGGMGALIGSFVPFIGPLVGFGIGALGGILKTWWDHAHEKPAEAGDDTQKKILQTLRDIHGTMIGGGERGRRVQSELEAETALRMSVLKGIG